MAALSVFEELKGNFEDFFEVVAPVEDAAK